MQINNNNLFLLLIIIFAFVPCNAMEKPEEQSNKSSGNCGAEFGSINPTPNSNNLNTDNKNSTSYPKPLPAIKYRPIHKPNSKPLAPVPNFNPINNIDQQTQRSPEIPAIVMTPKQSLPSAAQEIPGIRIRSPRIYSYNVNGTIINLTFSSLSTLAGNTDNAHHELFIGYTDFDRIRGVFDTEITRLKALMLDRNATISNLNTALEKEQSSLKTVGRLFGATMFVSFGAAAYTAITKNPNAFFNLVGFNTKHSAPVITAAFFTSGVLSGLISYHFGFFNFKK